MNKKIGVLLSTALVALPVISCGVTAVHVDLVVSNEYNHKSGKAFFNGLTNVETYGKYSEIYGDLGTEEVSYSYYLKPEDVPNVRNGNRFGVDFDGDKLERQLFYSMLELYSQNDIYTNPSESLTEFEVFYNPLKIVEGLDPDMMEQDEYTLKEVLGLEPLSVSPAPGSTVPTSFKKEQEQWVIDNIFNTSLFPSSLRNTFDPENPHWEIVGRTFVKEDGFTTDYSEMVFIFYDPSDPGIQEKEIAFKVVELANASDNVIDSANGPYKRWMRNESNGYNFYNASSVVQQSHEIIEAASILGNLFNHIKAGGVLFSEADRDFITNVADKLLGSLIFSSYSDNVKFDELYNSISILSLKDEIWKNVRENYLADIANILADNIII